MNRSIPAWAGEPCPGSGASFVVPVYPRVGGGTKLQRAHRRLDALARCVVDYHTRQLSQATIADVLDVSQQAISRSIQRTDPDDPEVRRIAALLG